MASARLLYVGQGRILGLLLRQFAKTWDVDHPQGQIFAAEARLECSWVVNGAWHVHHHLKLENDLVAAHILKACEIPAAQFLGYGSVRAQASALDSTVCQARVRRRLMPIDSGDGIRSGSAAKCSRSRAKHASRIPSTVRATI